MRFSLIWTRPRIVRSEAAGSYAPLNFPLTGTGRDAIINLRFYTLYPAKEDLFLETIENIQSRLTERVLDINRCQQTKAGFAQSMKDLVREYDSKPFLYHVNTPDFQAFIAKLPEETIRKIKLDSFAVFRQAVQAANLTLKMEQSQAFGILSALLATISAKETLSVTCDYFAVFDCMTDILVSRIFQ